MVPGGMTAPQSINTSKINRVEIIDHSIPLEEGGGRTVLVAGPAYGRPDDKNIELSFQDDGRTLKIFVTQKDDGMDTFGPYKIHSQKTCEGPCPFHNPSDHPLKDAKIHIRDDKMMLVERICEHGVGHDDPDSVAYYKAHGEEWAGTHGCDGCCTKN